MLGMNCPCFVKGLLWRWFDPGPSRFEKLLGWGWNSSGLRKPILSSLSQTWFWLDCRSLGNQGFSTSDLALDSSCLWEALGPECRFEMSCSKYWFGPECRFEMSPSKCRLGTCLFRKSGSTTLLEAHWSKILLKANWSKFWFEVSCSKYWFGVSCSKYWFGTVCRFEKFGINWWWFGKSGINWWFGWCWRFRFKLWDSKVGGTCLENKWGQINYDLHSSKDT